MASVLDHVLDVTSISIGRFFETSTSFARNPTFMNGFLNEICKNEFPSLLKGM